MADLTGEVDGAVALVGETLLLRAAAHSATATARTRVEAAVRGQSDLTVLIRLRPDMGLHIYRNLAVGMGEKRKRSGAGGSLNLV